MFRAALLALALLPGAAVASDRVEDRDTFLSLVQGRTLTSMGVALRVCQPARSRGARSGPMCAGAGSGVTGSSAANCLRRGGPIR